MTHPTLESLVSDIEALAQRAETLLGETAGEVEEGILERSEAALAAARARLQALDNAIRARARGVDAVAVLGRVTRTRDRAALEGRRCDRVGRAGGT